MVTAKQLLTDANLDKTHWGARIIAIENRAAELLRGMERR